MAQRQAQPAIRTVVLALLASVALMGCADGQNPFAKKTDDAASADDVPLVDATVTAPSATSVRLVDRDVEAPEVFQVTDDALWDGRPSLGGVWVASPDAKDPERVILRNPSNGKFVIGALFRREIDNPGPKLQISSDAAEALGVLAGQTAKINVTALRREEAPVTAPDASKPILDAAETVETEAIDPIPAAATAAPVKPGKPEKPAKPAAEPAAAAAPAAPAQPAATGGKRIQIGIFSVEANANRAAESLTKAGVAAEVRKDQSQGKTYWSVIAAGGSDAAATLTKVKGLGFKDAYLLK